MKETFERCQQQVVEPLPGNAAGPLSSQYDRPEKTAAIQSHKSRFSL